MISVVNVENIESPKMSDADRINSCREDIARVLKFYGCELETKTKFDVVDIIVAGIKLDMVREDSIKAIISIHILGS